MTQQTYVSEIDAISNAVQHYIEGARNGKGAPMAQVFHQDATIYGYVGNDLFGGPIQGLYDWSENAGPAKDIQTRLSSIDIVGTCANVRIDTDNWCGYRFTDFLNLVKFNGEWKIVSKVFYLHP